MKLIVNLNCNIRKEAQTESGKGKTMQRTFTPSSDFNFFFFFSMLVTDAVCVQIFMWSNVMVDKNPKGFCAVGKQLVSLNTFHLSFKRTELGQLRY